jgi:hypothetical protein
MKLFFDTITAQGALEVLRYINDVLMCSDQNMSRTIM